MLRRKKSIIEVDGRHYEAKYIGKGQFSKVYQIGDRVVMYTRGDCAKEVLAMYQYDRMTHLPELISHDKIILRNRDYDWWVFSSPYYRNVTIKDKSAYELMNRLIKLFNNVNSGGGRVVYRLDWMQLFVNTVKNIHTQDSQFGHFPNSVVKALQELVDIASNCGDNVGFDFHRKNFGVNEYGTLIFRDVFWVRS